MKLPLEPCPKCKSDKYRDGYCKSCGHLSPYAHVHSAPRSEVIKYDRQINRAATDDDSE